MVAGKAPVGRACEGWVDSWRGRLDVPAECTSVRDPRPGGNEGRLISGTGMRMGADARLVACSGKSTRPVLAARMSSRALLLACPCPARHQLDVTDDERHPHPVQDPSCQVNHSVLSEGPGFCYPHSACISSCHKAQSISTSTAASSRLAIYFKNSPLKFRSAQHKDILGPAQLSTFTHADEGASCPHLCAAPC